MLDKDYSGLIEFCSGPCELGDFLQLSGFVIFGLVVLIGILKFFVRFGKDPSMPWSTKL